MTWKPEELRHLPGPPKLLHSGQEFDSAREEARVKFLEAILNVGQAAPKSKAADVLPTLKQHVFPIYARLARPTDHPIEQYGFLTCWEVFNQYLPSPVLAGQITAIDNRIDKLLEVLGGISDADERTQALAEWNRMRETKARWEYEKSSEVPGLSALHGALMKWAASFHLTDPWILDYALTTMARWNCADKPERLDWEYVLWGFIPIIQFRDHRFLFPEWRPEEETWRRHKKKIDLAFAQGIEDQKKAFFEEYENTPKTRLTWRRRVEKLKIDYAAFLKQYRRVVRPGAERGDALHKRGNTHHYRWLVQFQVNGWKVSRIAWANTSRIIPDAVITDSSVSEAIHDLASIICLSLRPHNAAASRFSRRTQK